MAKKTTATKKTASPKKDSFNWINPQKDRWLTSAIPDGETCTPRVQRLNDEWFSCFRDGKYLGHEPTLEKAQERCEIGKVSDRNQQLLDWERDHPGELPPFLTLTEEERRQIRMRAPPLPQNATAEQKQDWKNKYTELPPDPRPSAKKERGAPPRDPVAERLRQQGMLGGTRTSSNHAVKLSEVKDGERLVREVKAAKAKLDRDQTITLVSKENPKKADAGRRFEFYRTVKTVGEYVDKVGDVRKAEADIKWDSGKGWIKLGEVR